MPRKKKGGPHPPKEGPITREWILRTYWKKHWGQAQHFRKRVEQALVRVLTGGDYRQEAEQLGISVDLLRLCFKRQLEVLLALRKRLERAEKRIIELQMLIQAHQITGPYRDDVPVETLHPPLSTLARLKKAGIDTVGKLRSVSPRAMLTLGCSLGDITWAMSALDSLGLTHNLTGRPKVANIIYYHEQSLSYMKPPAGSPF